MLKISTLPLSHLRNAEHVSFMNNVAFAIEKVGVESLDLPPAQLVAFKDAINQEQDIVNRSRGSVYTQDMLAIDLERDRLYKVIRFRLQSCALEGDDSELAEYRNSISMNILDKYGLEVTTQAYQVESALLRGFILDLRTFFKPTALSKMNIADELDNLESVNDQFTRQYNERVTEKSGTENEYSLKLRAETEDQYRHLILHFEYKANTEPDTDTGRSCASIAAIVEQLIKDARRALAARLGKGNVVEEEEE